VTSIPFFSPIIEFRRNQFASILNTNLFRKLSLLLQAVKLTSHTAYRRARVHFDDKTKTSIFVNDIQCTEALTALERVVLKTQRTSLVLIHAADLQSV
jgi:hypothetical protein